MAEKEFGLKPTTLNVELGDRSYPIIIAPGLLARVSKLTDLKSMAANHLVVITDENVASHYLDDVCRSLSEVTDRVDHMVLPAGESTKSTIQLDHVWQQLVQFGTTRRSMVLALGGGVVGDLAGFAAATFNRGIRFIQIPTTLLAQVDSSVGGKTGINLPQGKNLVGAFYQPQAVLIDPTVLNTLDARDYRGGIAEVVKYGAIMDANFFSDLETSQKAILAIESKVLSKTILRCCECKAQIVKEDELETSGRRAILNYGHTFGHAIENVYGYGEFTHGEAISIGMTCAARLAGKMGMLSDDLISRQTELLQGFGLPVECPDTKHDELLVAMKSDKKATRSGLNFVLPTRVGHVELVPAPDDQMILDSLKS